MFHREKRIGSVPAIASSAIGHSRIGLGFEKLDRGVFDPEKAYDKVAALGVKWIRIQSGWQRTETAPGVYDWGWLDDIVDNLRSRGLEPWMCLCYGNRLYTPAAAERFGGLGCPPVHTSKELSAWKAYVTATVRHYAGRVTWWEVWNEPDCEYAWGTECNPAEYAVLCRETAEAIRAGNPDAKVIGGSFAFARLEFVTPLLEAGFAQWCDAVTYHVYSSDETDDAERVENLRALLRRYRSGGLPVIQGEGGCQSSPDGCGALCGQMWTPAKQANSLARHFVNQLAQDLMFASFFSCMDMAEAQNGKVGESYRDFGYFGVLGAEFDERGVATGAYTPKPSYRTLQVISALFRGDFMVERIPVECLPENDARYGGSYRTADLARECFSAGFRRPSGAAAFVYWKKGSILREKYEGSVSLAFGQVPATTVRLIDLLDGSIYEPAPEQLEIVEKDGLALVRLHAIPLLDSPVAIEFGDFLELGK
ncbi:MAG: cellulase family glycosylhydrolase [Victivallales bacterium]|nr:cellulase family glycosylhydrolase [Victivallales bacterium]